MGHSFAADIQEVFFLERLFWFSLDRVRAMEGMLEVYSKGSIFAISRQIQILQRDETK
jgi:hypothetical protein